MVEDEKREKTTAEKRKEYEGKGFMPKDLRPWDGTQKGAAVCVRFKNYIGAEHMMWLNRLGFVVEEIWPEATSCVRSTFEIDSGVTINLIAKCAGEKGELTKEAEAYLVVDANLFERWLRGYRKPKKEKKGAK